MFNIYHRNHPGFSILESVPAMAYDCEAAVDWKKMLQYIHFNRHSNTLLIEHNMKLIRELKASVQEIICVAPWTRLSTGCYR